MNRTVSVILWVIVTLTVGFISSFFQSASSSEWYDTLQRSSLTPP
ncbi:MAG: tryptophan-rich sensory protein, partial [Bacteroidaceae bacterium]|nr:tryptophan-rich sensory protein [Bacteroidaceae bacterium]